MDVVNHCHAQEDDDVVWVLDSGATHHFVRDEKLLQNAVSCADQINNSEGFTGKSSSITCTGDFVALLTNQRMESEIRLHHVFCLSDLKVNVLSISQLATDFPLNVIFKPSGFLVMHLEINEEIAKGKLRGNYYEIHVSTRRKDGNPEARSMLNAVCQPVVASSNELAAESVQELSGDSCASGMPVLEAKKEDDGCCPESADHMPTLDDRKAGDAWIVDTGATTHFTKNKEFLQNLWPLPKPSFLQDFAGRRSPVTHIGDAYLPRRGHGGITLRGILLVPEAKGSFISVRKLISEHPSCLEFRSDGFVLKSLEKDSVIAEGPKHRNRYLWLNKRIQSEPHETVENSHFPPSLKG